MWGKPLAVEALVYDLLAVQDRILREDLWCTLKIYLFSWKKGTFSALAAIWPFFEHLYSEMVSTPPCVIEVHAHLHMHMRFRFHYA
jgi:hypothetical protein